MSSRAFQLDEVDENNSVQYNVHERGGAICSIRI